MLLFADENSYNAASQRLFGESGVSVYGYYRPNQRTLLLNAATGAGTLLHELTHALMDFDFPDAPHWFNEGLASLHEQCRFREDERGPWIEGVPNWRLRGLQHAIGQRRLRPLRAMIAEADFHGVLEGTNYAHARYFCLYMQQRGLLERFFHQFRAAHAHDPSGEATLARLFSPATWEELDLDFQRLGPNAGRIAPSRSDRRASRSKPRANRSGTPGGWSLYSAHDVVRLTRFARRVAMDYDYLILCAAAVLGGAINSIAGGGTLLTFPALYAALGSSATAAVVANATSTVALVPGSVAALAGYRGEIREEQTWALRGRRRAWPAGSWDRCWWLRCQPSRSRWPSLG